MPQAETPDAKILSPETPKAPEITPEQELAALDQSADAEMQDFSTEQRAGVDSAIQTGADLGFSQREVAQRLESSGVNSTLSNLKDKAETVYSGFKKVVAVGMSALSMGAAQEAIPAMQVVEKLVPKQSREQVLELVPKPPEISQFQNRLAQAQETDVGSAKESPAEVEEAETVTEADIKNNVLTGDQEITYVGSGSLENFLVLDKGDTAAVLHDISKIRELARGKDSIVSIHTHPVAAYEGMGYLSTEQARQVADGEISAPIGPPSDGDFRTAATVDYFLRKDNKKVNLTHRVYEPSGVWNFQIDPGHPFVKYMQGAAQAVDKGVKEAFSRLTEKERVEFGILTKKVKTVTDIPNLGDPDQIEALNEKLSGSKHAAKVESIITSANLVLSDMEMVAEELRASTIVGHKPEEIQGLINMYSGLCKRNGIEVQYKPNPILPESQPQVQAPVVEAKTPATQAADELPELGVEKDQPPESDAPRSSPPLAKDNPQREYLSSQEAYLEKVAGKENEARLSRVESIKFTLAQAEQNRQAAHEAGDTESELEAVRELVQFQKFLEEENQPLTGKDLEHFSPRTRKEVKADLPRIPEEAADAFKKYDTQREWLAGVTHSPEYEEKALKNEGLTQQQLNRRREASLRDEVNLDDQFHKIKKGSLGDTDLASGKRPSIKARFGKIPEGERELHGGSERFQDNPTVVHEMEHEITDGGLGMSERAKTLYQEAYNGPRKDTKNGAYFSQPTELDARKKSFEFELEKNGVWKYGEPFTQEHLQKALQLEKEGKLTNDSQVFINYLKHDKIPEIMNTIAENRTVSPGGEASIKA